MSIVDVRNFYDYSPLSGVSFAQFLRQSSRFQGQAISLLEGSYRELGSLKQIQARGWQEQQGAQKAGFTALSKRLDSIGQSVDRANRGLDEISETIRAGTNELLSALRWGFSSLTASIGRVEDVLERIDKKLGAPSRTWAEEQYYEACYSYQNGLYADALEYVECAICGHGSNRGRKIDPRFHYLLGRIKIGSWLGNHPNTDLEIVNLEVAERAFQDAAKYGVGTNYRDQAEKGEAFLFAARAAYLQGNLRRAIDHASSGLKILKWLSESLTKELTQGRHRDWHDARRFSSSLNAICNSGSFQYAKYLCANGWTRDAENELLHLFRADVGQVINAKSDIDILREPIALSNALAAITRELSGTYSVKLALYKMEIEKLNDLSFSGISANSLLAEELGSAVRALNAVTDEAANGGPLDYDAAITMAASLPNLTGLFRTFQERCEREMERRWLDSSAVATVASARAISEAADGALETAKRNSRQVEVDSQERSVAPIVLSVIVAVISGAAILNSLTDKYGPLPELTFFSFPFFCGSLFVLSRAVAWWNRQIAVSKEAIAPAQAAASAAQIALKRATKARDEVRLPTQLAIDNLKRLKNPL